MCETKTDATDATATDATATDAAATNAENAKKRSATNPMGFVAFRSRAFPRVVLMVGGCYVCAECAWARLRQPTRIRFRDFRGVSYC